MSVHPTYSQLSFTPAIIASTLSKDRSACIGALKLGDVGLHVEVHGAAEKQVAQQGVVQHRDVETN